MCDEKEHPLKFEGKSMETKTTTESEFPKGGTATVEKILVSEERNKSKRAGLKHK